MPPYGIDSLLNRDFDTQGYFTSLIEKKYDPAFGTLNFNRAYGPAPFTGNIPLTSYRVEPGLQYLSDDGRLRNLGFEGDIDLPSFGGVSGYRDTGGIMGIEPAARKTSTFVEDDDLEASALSEFAEGQLKQSPTGIARLFEFLSNLPTPFNLVRRGLESLSGVNQRLRNTDFGQSRTGAEYFMKRRERKQAERAQKAMPDVYREAKERGFTNERGGFSTNRADRAGTSIGSGQFSPKRSTGRSGY